jgi:hypothetical protein
MASEDTHAHSHGNMVAQPVDPISAAQASAAMSQAGSADGKEAISFDLSEDSPDKERADVDACFGGPSKYRLARTPRTSPSPSRSKTRRPSLPRSIPVKRSSSTPSSIPMLPRRGRVAVTDAELWGAEGRMVHRKVEYDTTVGKDDASVLPLIAEQFAADRAAMAQVLCRRSGPI